MIILCPRGVFCSVPSVILQIYQSAFQQPQQGDDRIGTICYPNGDVFEGEVGSVLRAGQSQRISIQGDT